MGTIAQANASVLRFAKETAYGVAPTTSYNTARIISANLAQRTGFTQSGQLNTSRQPTDQIRNQVSAEGSVGFEFSAISHQTFLESLFGGQFTTVVTGTSTASIAVSASTATITTSTSLFNTVEVGDWVRVNNFSNSTNNGSFYVLAKTSSASITVALSGGSAETGRPTVGFNSTRLAVGSSLVSMTLEQTVPTGPAGGGEALYEKAQGCAISAMRLDIAPGEIIRGNFDWVGKNVLQSTTQQTGGTIAISTTQIANALDNVIQIREGAMSPKETWKVASFSLNVTSPAEPRFAISDEQGVQPGAIGLALRPFGATATMRVYVEHTSGETTGVKSIIDSYLAGQARSGLAIVIADLTTPATPYSAAVSGYHTIFHFNSYKITRADIPIGGNDQDLFLEMEIAAVQDPTAGGASGPWSFMIHQNQGL